MASIPNVVFGIILTFLCWVAFIELPWHGDSEEQRWIADSSSWVDKIFNYIDIIRVSTYCNVFAEAKLGKKSAGRKISGLLLQDSASQQLPNSENGSEA